VDATQVGFYGLGSSSSQSDRANFRLQKAYATADAKARALKVVVVRGGIGYEDYREKEGLGRFDPVEARYTPGTAPGLGIDPSYVHGSASAGIDWRPAEGYARRGGLYELRFHRYEQRGSGANSFDRAEAEVVQHVPVLRENWVFSARGLVNTTVNGDPPYFLLPSLGSSSTLRGYPAWRFRDRHSILVQGEFRWIPNRTGLDMAIVYDAGKVAPRRSELRLRHLKHDVGVEVRFHGPSSTPLRLGVARGSEGWQLVFGGSAAF
jgi:hypothetical protein